MLLHNILTSNEDRLIKEIVEDQIKDTWPGCWTERVKIICEKYDLNIHNIKRYTKDNLKQVVKSKINTLTNKEIFEESQQKTKL